MSFNTYVINLKHDTQNWTNITNSFSKHNIKPIRYNAIYGKHKSRVNKHNDRINKVCQKFCPYGVIGCGLSNLKLIDYIYDNDEGDHALICEDDISIREDVKDIGDEIRFVIDNSPEEWDIILLFCQGFCKYNNDELFNKVNSYMGSTACYLVNIKNMYKTNQIKLKKHIDRQLCSDNKLNIYAYNKQLFETNDIISYNNVNDIQLYNWLKLDNMFNTTIDRSLNFKQLKIPFIDIELTTKHFLYILTLICIYLLIVFEKQKYIIPSLIIIYIIPIILFVTLDNLYG
jgi:hypothetical protein